MTPILHDYWRSPAACRARHGCPRSPPRTLTATSPPERAGSLGPIDLWTDSRDGAPYFGNGSGRPRQPDWRNPMSKPFASSADTLEKSDTLEILADGVYALTAEGDPNVGAVEGEDFVVAIESRATPAAARDWLKILREQTDKPVRFLVLTHYHAVRVLGASAFEARGHHHVDRLARQLVAERGEQDWKSEFGRMPRLAKNADEVPGLTWPTITFGTDMRDRARRRPRRARPEVPRPRPHRRRHRRLARQEPHPLRRRPRRGQGRALHRRRLPLRLGDGHARQRQGLPLGEPDRRPRRRGARRRRDRRGGRADAEVPERHDRERRPRPQGAAARSRTPSRRPTPPSRPEFGAWPIFEHCLPFDVQRLWDEFDGIEHPRIWTAERDREVWAKLQG